MKRALFIYGTLIVIILSSLPFAYAGSATVHWQANIEPDLKGYNVYYGTTSRLYGPPVPVGNVTSYTIDDLKPGSTYYFAVTAVDLSGNGSGYSDEVQKTIPTNIPIQTLDISLHKGWNLISLNLEPKDSSSRAIMTTVSDKVVSIYSFENNTWKIYDPQRPGISNLTNLRAGIGYYVKMKDAGMLSVSGSQASKSVSLTKGWNLVGYNAKNSQPINQALSSIAGKFSSVWTFEDGRWEFYSPFNIGFNDLTLMEPGGGYWIYAVEACTWNLP